MQFGTDTAQGRRHNGRRDGRDEGVGSYDESHCPLAPVRPIFGVGRVIGTVPGHLCAHIRYVHFTLSPQRIILARLGDSGLETDSGFEGSACFSGS